MDRVVYIFKKRVLYFRIPIYPDTFENGVGHIKNDCLSILFFVVNRIETQDFSFS